MTMLAVIRAKRLWRGGAALLDDAAGGASEPGGAEADALLVVDGQIAVIDTTAEVLRQYAARGATGGAGGPTCRVIDCQWRYFVSPGFVDAHVHFLDGGRQLRGLSFDYARSKEDFQRVLRLLLAQRAAGDSASWVFGTGWSEVVLGGATPTREWLDEVSTAAPIIIFRKDVHSAVYNTLALQLCHVMERPSATEPAAAAYQRFVQDPAHLTDPLLGPVEGGVFERDPGTGAPTGVLRDNAMNATKRYWPKADSEDSMRAAMELASAYFLSRGYTFVFSMTSVWYDNLEEIDFLLRMEREGKLRLRVRMAVRPHEAEGLIERYYMPLASSRRGAGHPTGAGGSTAALLSRPFCFDPLLPEEGGGFVHLGAVKFFSDGSLSSRTAAMLRPYAADDAGTAFDGELAEADDAETHHCAHCGLLTMTEEELRAALRMARGLCLQCCVHAIGDRAVATMNRLFEEERTRATTNNAATLASIACPDDWASFQRDPRDRIEHCQHLGRVATEVARMRRNNVIASMQPCHLLFDGDYVDHLIGRERKKKSYLWRTLLSNGVRVAFGSDWMVAPADVMDGLRAAVTRVPDVMSHQAACHAAAADGASQPAVAPPAAPEHEVWTSSERLTVEEALRGFTYGGVYGAYLEDVLGTLDVGKWADIAILSEDVLDPSGRVSQSADAEKLPWWPRGREPQVMFTIVGGKVAYERPAAP